MTDFVECDACRAKPGSPTLCSACLMNRSTISTLANQRFGLLEAMGLVARASMAGFGFALAAAANDERPLAIATGVVCSILTILRLITIARRE